jgi:hypothetical protein
MKRAWLSIVIMTLAGTALAQAQKSALTPEAEKALQAAAKKIEAWGSDPEIIKAVLAQNARTMTLAQIKEIDAAWAAGGAADRVQQLLTNPCALRLKALIGSSSAYGESFVMDDQGGNVCMTDKTSDYWQGDEAKWQNSFNGGQGRVFVDKPRYDTSAKAILVQISVPVVQAGKAIGAITVGVVPEALAK